MTGNALASLGDLTKPTTILIEKIYNTPTQRTSTPASTPRSKATDRSVRPTRALLEPEPLIVFGFLYQSAADGVLTDVLQFLFKALLRAQDVVEGFLLPDWAAGVQEFVNASR